MIENLTIKPETLNKKVSIRISRQEFINLREEAVKSGLSLSNLMRRKLLSRNNFLHEIQKNISKMTELQKEAISQLEFISIQVVKEEKVKE